MTTTAPAAPDLDAFLGQAVTDFGAAATVAMVLVGDRLGFYRALAEAGAQTPEELAARTGTHPRLVREWLHNQAAAGYVVVAGDLFALTPAAAFALSDPDSPVYLGGLSEVLTAVFLGLDKVVEGFRTGRGLAGQSTTRACSPAPSASSAPVTPPTWCRSGFPRWTVSSRSWSRAPASRTSAAATAPPPP